MGSQSKGDKQNTKTTQSNSKSNKQNSQKMGKSNTKAASKSSKKGNKLVGDVITIIILGGLFYFLYMIFAKTADVVAANPELLQGFEAVAAPEEIPLQAAESLFSQAPKFLQQFQNSFSGNSSSLPAYPSLNPASIQQYISNSASALSPYVQNFLPLKQ